MKIPYLSYSNVRDEALSFLSKFHPSHDLPIPIETIIDVQLGINIFPLPRLYKDHGQNGYLSRDRKTIYIDDLQYEQLNEKYRFTLAHELAHYVLHKDCYDQVIYTSCEEYIKWRLSVDPEKIGWLDTQAQWFAGIILVPTEQLKKCCQHIIEKYKNKLPGINLRSDDFWSYASNEIAKHFDVNPLVVEIRIKKENIAQEIKF